MVSVVNWLGRFGRPSRELPPRLEPSPSPRSTHLPADLVKKVRRIEIATHRLVDQGVAGDYHSVFKGRGVEFSEVRAYQPGDDVRSIDWNVTARRGEPFVKTFVEERDLSIFLAVDVSGSLNYGSRSITKRELAAEVSALLAFAAIRNQDRVGAALISDGIDLFLPPRRRRTDALRLVREILDRPARGGTDLERGLSAVLATLTRRSVLFVISDFVRAACPRALKAAAVRHDVIVLEIVDPRDLAAPSAVERPAPIVLTDAETGRTALVAGDRFGRGLAQDRERERAELHRLLKKLGVDRLELRTDRPYLPTLLDFFERRRKKFAR